MGLHTILENENQYQAGFTKKSVQPSGCRRPKSEKADEKEKLSSRNFLLNNLNGDLMEMYSENSSSPYRRSMPSRPFGMDVQGDEMIRRRGSVYQSSSEVRQMKRLQEYRRKVEQAQGDDAFLSFEISNSSSLHGQSKSRLLARKKKSLSTSTKDQNSAATDSTIMTSSDDFLDLSFRPLQEHQPAASHSLRGSVVEKGETSEDFLEITLFPDGLGKCRSNTVSEPAGTDSFEVSIPRCDTNLCLENDCNVPSQGDKRQPLAKSFSTKVGMLRSFDHSDDVFKVSPGSRFGPSRKTLDCMAKSKSQRSPILSREEKGGDAKADSTGTMSNGRPKSFFNDISGTPNKTEKMIPEVMDMQVEEMASSPVHLSATLKLDKRCGKSSFEFLTKDPEDCLSAKAWRTNSALNWVYTFHRNKTRNSSWAMKDRCKQPPQLIGQMQASCYLCSEISKHQSLENTTVMEFVLYDIAQARRNTAGYERSNGLAEDPQTQKDALVDNSIRGSSIEGDGTIDSKKPKLSSQASTGDVNPDVPDSRPLAPADLFPSLEVAAIAMQVPCEMKESFRNRKVGDDNVNERQSIANQDTRTPVRELYPPNLKVIIPSGRHGLPCTEGCPSPLLDRWKSGGGCDCGGWDMGCPIAIFDNKQCENTINCFPKKGYQPLKLFSQGKKDNIPSLTMSPHDDGQYSVHFHAKFSSLQAFSICVAILHGLESFSINGEDTNVPMLHSKSLKLLLEEEVRHLLGAVAEKEKMKAKQMNADSLPVRYVLDPPFSPIGRV